MFNLNLQLELGVEYLLLAISWEKTMTSTNTRINIRNLANFTIGKLNRVRKKLRNDKGLLMGSVPFPNSKVSEN